MSTPITSAISAPPLVRGLTAVLASAVIIVNVIGTGVFLKARVMTCNVGMPGLVLTVYIVAGLLSLAGALTYSELGTMIPRARGEYNFIGAAYGRRWAFMYGPALFLLVVAYLLINTLLVALGRSLAGLGLIALGLPVYAYYVRRSVTPLRDYWLKSEETVDENQEPLQIGKQIINDYSQDRIGTYD